jgi:hypothetical protein
VSGFPADWSNAKRARIFAHVIGHLTVKYGRGVLRIPMRVLEEGFPTVGFDRDGDDLLIAVDMDDFPAPAREGRLAALRRLRVAVERHFIRFDTEVLSTDLDVLDELIGEEPSIPVSELRSLAEAMGRGGWQYPSEFQAALNRECDKAEGKTDG